MRNSLGSAPAEHETNGCSRENASKAREVRDAVWLRLEELTVQLHLKAQQNNNMYM